MVTPEAWALFVKETPLVQRRAKDAILGVGKLALHRVGKVVPKASTRAHSAPPRRETVVPKK